MEYQDVFCVASNLAILRNLVAPVPVSLIVENPTRYLSSSAEKARLAADFIIMMRLR